MCEAGYGSSARSWSAELRIAAADNSAQIVLQGAHVSQRGVGGDLEKLKILKGTNTWQKHTDPRNVSETFRETCAESTPRGPDGWRHIVRGEGGARCSSIFCPFPRMRQSQKPCPNFSHFSSNVPLYQCTRPLRAMPSSLSSAISADADCK